MREWVLIRGMMSEAFHWWDFLPQLQQAFPKDHFHLPNIHGTGPTGMALTPRDVQTNLKLLRGQIHSTSKSPKVLLGFSLGGMMALEWAHFHPEEVEAVILINCSLNGSRFYHRMTPFAFKHIFKMALKKDPILQNEMGLAMTTSFGPEKVRELAPHWNARGLEFPVSPMNFFTQLILAHRVPMRAQPPAAPILVLSGGKDRVVHPQCSLDIAQGWNLPLHVHPEAGHDLTLNDPQWVVEKIKSWSVLEK
jgi:pimeloyl-ACP methyl ester carboxylesterase